MEKIFEIIFVASYEDVYVEVRQAGMIFWKTILQKIVGEFASDKIKIIEYLRKLSLVGYFQVRHLEILKIFLRKFCF